MTKESLSCKTQTGIGNIRSTNIPGKAHVREEKGNDLNSGMAMNTEATQCGATDFPLIWSLQLSSYPCFVGFSFYALESRLHPPLSKCSRSDQSLLLAGNLVDTADSITIKEQKHSCLTLIMVPMSKRRFSSLYRIYWIICFDKKFYTN